MARLPHNLERLPGNAHITGYGAGLVWHITRTNSSYGNWSARPAPHVPHDVAQRMPTLFAFTLADMGAKLSALPQGASQ